MAHITLSKTKHREINFSPCFIRMERDRGLYFYQGQEAVC